MSDLKTSIINISKNTDLVPFLKGPHGIGKTSFIRQLADELGLTFFTLNLSSCESSDFQGLPYISEGKTCYARPMFFDTDLLFLDEVDRVRDLSVKAALNSLLLDRTINGNALKRGCMIVCAGNYDSDNYETSDFDPSLKDRLAFFDFKISTSDRLDFFKKELGPDNAFVKFLQTKPEIFSDLSPRRLFNAAKIHTDELSLESLIGKELSRVFINFKESGLVSLRSILDNQTDFMRLSTMTRISLVNATVDSLSDLKKESLKCILNLNDFINELSAEEKSLYFSKLKNELIKGNIDKQELESLNELGLFKGQKIYLKELI